MGRVEAAAENCAAGTGVDDFEAVRELLAEEEAAVEVCVSIKRAVWARSCLRLFQFGPCAPTRSAAEADLVLVEGAVGAGRF